MVQCAQQHANPRYGLMVSRTRMIICQVVPYSLAIALTESLF
jgi:hypothetical protein